MSPSLHSKLHQREVAPNHGRKWFPALYSAKQLIADLDIVNELDGHSGCVNALSWSTSGNLLASGSDDQHLNIHTYQPSNSQQFQLTATVATGHTQNIFSVQFMPHSSDHTVITCAGDSEVRIFDLEYAGQPTAASSASLTALESRRSRRQQFFSNVKYHHDGDTNCRVYRSHGERAKRIVTESSPHLFLTCSEDGEVRQWDLRQPSSAYPSPRQAGRSSDLSVPPPLISYKRYGLDLNSISCSASQPHYIALGGAHLHVFLHDRRMTGRDKLQEAGRPLPSVHSLSQRDQEMLSQATQCVRKFAPRGQTRMKAGDDGHITGCKISDARPDEMVVSWSRDHIYSFDLIRDTVPDREETAARSKRRTHESRDRKRKRKVTGSESSLPHNDTNPSRLRTAPEASQAALRIQYSNGQSEEIPIPNSRRQEPVLTHRQRIARKMAETVHKIRQSLFEQATPDISLIIQYTPALTSAAEILSEMDEMMREWSYPLDPYPSDVYVHRTLRRHREGCRRFVQAAGTLARVLGGTSDNPALAGRISSHFSKVQAYRSNYLEPSPVEKFGYEFLKAILLWLDSGIGRLIEGFTRPSGVPPSVRAASGLPIPESEAGPEAVDEYLIPYLLSLAGTDDPVVNLDTNRFLTDANRQLFSDQRQAVLAFAEAVKKPFADLSSPEALSTIDPQEPEAQDRHTAHDFWARKVGRALLYKAAQHVKFEFVNTAFDGYPGLALSPSNPELDFLMTWGDHHDVAEDVQMLETQLEDEPDDVGPGALLVEASDRARSANEREREPNHAWADTAGSSEDDDDDDYYDDDYGDVDEERQGDEGASENEDDDESEDEDEDDDEDDNDDDDVAIDDVISDSSSELDEEDGVPNLGPPLGYRSIFSRRRDRARVEPNTPCSAPTRTYSGHCNVKTVKDVNYFGPDDEYVVSGSDDGNFFIWDRKTSEIVNVLEGDGEVVNVIQGHPYETLLAVSGIDHTIKIFSPDARARDAARLGKGVFAHDSSKFSSLDWPLRAGHRLARRRSQLTTESVFAATEAVVAAGPTDAQSDFEQHEEYVAPNGLRSRRRLPDVEDIIERNHAERRGRNYDTIITMLFGQLGNMQDFNY